MVYTIDAIFNNLEDAKLAADDIRMSMEVDKMKLYTREKLKKYIRSKNQLSVITGVFSTLGLGVIAGLLIGAILRFLILYSFPDLIYMEYANYGFVIAGLFIGMFFSMHIFMITQEKVLPLSDRDLHKKQILMILQATDIEIDKLNKILKDHRALEIHML